MARPRSAAPSGRCRKARSRATPGPQRPQPPGRPKQTPGGGPGAPDRDGDSLTRQRRHNLGPSASAICSGSGAHRNCQQTTVFIHRNAFRQQQLTLHPVQPLPAQAHGTPLSIHHRCQGIDDGKLSRRRASHLPSAAMAQSSQPLPRSPTTRGISATAAGRLSNRLPILAVSPIH